MSRQNLFMTTRSSAAKATSHWLTPLATVALAAICLNLAACKWLLPPLGYNNGYEPDQPIAYSHELHAGQYKIQCLYCHSNAERTNHASVPPLSTCVTKCHLNIATDKPAIQKLQAAYAANKPIAWVKVNRLPDYVHFNHVRHINSGVACKVCHGPIETMARVKQVLPLSMGSCLECHRAHENKGPETCTKCHH